MLRVNEVMLRDSGIESYEIHSHYPYASSKLDKGEEIIISVQHQDVYTHPSKSCIYIEGKFLKEDGTAAAPSATPTNNWLAYLFDEIRYELNSVEIDRVKNPGVSTTLKGLASLGHNDHVSENYGWDLTNRQPLVSGGCFSACLPLSALLGFAEDYRKIIINVKQDLILIRSRKDTNCFVEAGADQNTRIEVTKIVWKLPYVTVATQERLLLLKQLDQGKSIGLNFRSWELYEYPLLPMTQKQIWTVKTSTQLEKPRFIILGFQTDRKDNSSKDASQFDHCNLANIKVFLNSKSYPYDDLNLNFEKENFAMLYHMYCDFKYSYYNINTDHAFCGAALSRRDFITKYPIVVIDCSKQVETVKTGSVDIKIEFESDKSFPAKTSAYCLIIHNKLVTYTPLTGIVRKAV